jgi:uncharacterized membrane protein YqjE
MDLSSCEECEQNALLDDGCCKCKPNYVHINEQCLGPSLVLGEVVDSSTIRIKFSPDIREPLSASDVQVLLGELNVPFALVHDTDITYTITLPEGTNLEETVMSVGGLDVRIPTYSKETSKSTSTSKDFSVTSAATYGLLLAGVLSGLLSGSWGPLWSILSALQLISYIPMQDIPLPSTLSNFLAKVIDLSMIPSGFSNSPAESPSSPSNLQRIQIDSTTFLSNTEFPLGLFMATLLSGGVAYLLSLCCSVDIKLSCEKYLQGFKFNFFIRFLLVNCMKLTFSSLLHLIHWSLDTTYRVFNTVLSIFFYATAFAFPACILRLIRRNSGRLQDQDLIQRFGSAFKEFKNDRGVLSSLFYFFYCVRRLIYSFILFFLEAYPAAQVTINSSMSVLVIVYMVYYQAYTPRRYFWYNLYLEAVTAVVFIVTGFWLLDLSQLISDALMYGITTLVSSIGVLNLVLLIYDFVIFLKKARRNSEIRIDL